MKPIARIISLMLIYVLPFVSCSVSKNITAGHDFHEEYSAEFKRFSANIISNTVHAKYLYTSHTSFSLAQWTLQSIYMTRIEENVLCPAAYLKREEAHPDVVI